MSGSAGALRLEAYGALEAVRLRERLADVWDAAYAGTERARDPWFSRAAFLRRLVGDADRPGYVSRPDFRLRTFWAAEELVAFGYGFALTDGSGWLGAVTPPLPSELTREDGERSWAVAELVVAPEWRRGGLATQMHESFERELGHSRFVLLVEPDNTPAHTGYLSWGYRSVGALALPGFPPYTAMVLDRDADQPPDRPATEDRSPGIRPPSHGNEGRGTRRPGVGHSR